MNNIKKLLLITLISSVAIFSSCGDDDEPTAAVSCLSCTYSEVDDLLGIMAALNEAWVDLCPGDIIEGEPGEEIIMTATSIEMLKELYEDPDLYGATCVYVDKN